jgi:multiple sugar transport system permease protein
MTTVQKTVVQVSPEVKALHQRMLQRQRLGRTLTYLVGILISLWVLIPILFITSMALTTPAEVRSYPKGILPFIPLSTETMEFFLNSTGILPGLRNSIVVAVITLILSTLIAAPAGYALSRFIFRGRDVFRLSILAVRAFPIVILSIPLAVVFLRTGIYDSVFSLALMHTALALPTTILVLSSVFSSIPYELEEAAMVFGCSPAQAFRHVVLPMCWLL